MPRGSITTDLVLSVRMFVFCAHTPTLQVVSGNTRAGKHERHRRSYPHSVGEQRKILSLLNLKHVDKQVASGNGIWSPAGVCVPLCLWCHSSQATLCLIVKSPSSDSICYACSVFATGCGIKQVPCNLGHSTHIGQATLTNAGAHCARAHMHRRCLYHYISHCARAHTHRR